MLKNFPLVETQTRREYALCTSEENKLQKSTISLLHFSCVKIICDGSNALSGSQNCSLRLWDLDPNARLKEDRSGSRFQGITDIAVTRDGSRCISASMDGKFKIWQCETAEECSTFTGSQT